MNSTQKCFNVPHLFFVSYLQILAILFILLMLVQWCHLSHLCIFIRPMQPMNFCYPTKILIIDSVSFFPPMCCHNLRHCANWNFTQSPPSSVILCFFTLCVSLILLSWQKLIVEFVTDVCTFVFVMKQCTEVDTNKMRRKFSGFFLHFSLCKKRNNEHSTKLR